jgi:hypothetical protein
MAGRVGRDGSVVRVSQTTPNRVTGTILSQHRTSMGLVRYRRWEDSITIELLLPDERTVTVAVVPGAARRP